MLEVLKYTLPALMVLCCTWVVLYQMLRRDQEKRLWELKRESQKEITPLRLRAYERLALLLERTQPEHLLLEMNVTEMDILTMQQHLLKEVRMEFDHNLSQQIYVSDEVWAKIIQARDEMGAFVSTMAQQMPKGSTGMDYAKVLMTAYRNNGVTPHQIALGALNDEAKRLLSH